MTGSSWSTPMSAMTSSVSGAEHLAGRQDVGQQAGGRPSASMTGRDQSPVRASSRPVVEALVSSATCLPVSQ